MGGAATGLLALLKGLWLLEVVLVLGLDSWAVHALQTLSKERLVADLFLGGFSSTFDLNWWLW
jgi:hypothetical protein